MHPIDEVIAYAHATQLFRSVDLQFARLLCEGDRPDYFLAAACVSASAGEGHVCLPLAALTPDALWTGAQRIAARAQRIGRDLIIIAATANARAARLAAGLAALPGVTLLHPVEANIVFAAFPEAGHRALEAAGARYYRWPAEGCLHPAARLVCGWSTREAEIDRALAILAGALHPSAG